MDTLDNELSPVENGGLMLSVFAVHDLKKAAKWAQFLAIIGFIGSGIIGIMALFIGGILAKMAQLNPMGAAIPTAVTSFITVVYLILAVVTFILHLFLYQFATRTINAIAANNGAGLDGGMHRLQSYFKMMGIIVIIELAVFVLVFIGCMIAFAAAMNSAGMH